MSPEIVGTYSESLKRNKLQLRTNNRALPKYATWCIMTNQINAVRGTSGVFEKKKKFSYGLYRPIRLIPSLLASHVVDFI